MDICAAPQQDNVISNQQASLAKWNRSVELQADVWELDTRGCYATFVDVLGTIADDCSDEVLEALFAGYQNKDYSMMGSALADCIHASCRQYAMEYIPRPL